MQCTVTPNGPLAVSREGLPSDEDMAALAAVGPLLAVRLLVTTSGGGCSCRTSGPHLVAVRPADPTAPPAERAAVAAVGPGTGAAGRRSAHLRGATVALTGLDVAVREVVDLVGEAPAGLLLLALADLATSLARTPAQHAPDLRTLVVVDAAPSSPLPATGDDAAWQRERTTGGWVPLTTGLAGAEHACTAVGAA